MKKFFPKLAAVLAVAFLLPLGGCSYCPERAEQYACYRGVSGGVSASACPQFGNRYYYPGYRRGGGKFIKHDGRGGYRNGDFGRFQSYHENRHVSRRSRGDW